MLLIGEVDVIKQGALTWQERTGDLEGLCVPVLRLSRSETKLSCFKDTGSKKRGRADFEMSDDTNTQHQIQISN